MGIWSFSWVLHLTAPRSSHRLCTRKSDSWEPFMRYMVSSQTLKPRTSVCLHPVCLTLQQNMCGMLALHSGKCKSIHSQVSKHFAEGGYIYNTFWKTLLFVFQFFKVIKELVAHMCLKQYWWSHHRALMQVDFEESRELHDCIGHVLWLFFFFLSSIIVSMSISFAYYKCILFFISQSCLC